MRILFALCVLMTLSISAAQVDSLAAPSDPASAMFSLESIYNRLDTGAAGAKRSAGFTDPTTGPIASLHTLNDVMAKAPASDAKNGASAAQVLAGKTYWSLLPGGWGSATGSMPNNGGVTIAPGTVDQTIALGYHDGTGKVNGDANLLTGNIKSGVSIFGVAGSTNVVDTTEAASPAGADNILIAKKAFVNGSSVTGTMPNNGGVTISPSTVNQTIALGFHDGTGKVNGDANLIAANIKSGINIFGVAGSTNVVDTSAGTAAAGDMLNGKTAYVNGSLITGTVPAGANVTGGNGLLSFTITNGLYSGNKTATAGDTNLLAANIKSGIAIFGVTGTAPIPSGNATVANVLSGQTFSNGTSTGLTGTMANNGSVTITPGTSAQTIAAGFHNGLGTVSGDLNLVTGNIRAGTTIFGVAGKTSVVETSTGTAASTDISNGKVAFVNGAQITGSNNIISSGNATANDVLIGKTFSNSATAGVTGTRPIVPVAKTGQTSSSAANDDGANQKGIAPPTPRFTDNGNGTVTDNLTGLIWLKNANVFNTRTWAQALADCSALADGSGGLTDGSTAGQWRLPNVREIVSLIDYKNLNSAVPTGHPFTLVLANVYWTSTTSAEFANGSAWRISLYNGETLAASKTSSYYVWPVRGGQ